MRDRGWHLIYPAYLDSTRSRSEGRRVARSLAVDRPRAEEILEAVRELGLEARLDEEARYPRSWWMDRGRVLVRRSMPKTQLLRLVASKLREIRARRRTR